MLDMDLFRSRIVPAMPMTDTYISSVFGPLEFEALARISNWLSNNVPMAKQFQTSVVLFSLVPFTDADFVVRNREFGHGVTIDQNGNGRPLLISIRLPELTDPKELAGGILSIHGDPLEGDTLDVHFESRNANPSTAITNLTGGLFWGKNFPLTLVDCQAEFIPRYLEIGNFSYERPRDALHPILTSVGRVSSFWSNAVPIARTEHIVACIPHLVPIAERPYPTLDRSDPLTYDEIGELLFEFRSLDSVEDTITWCAVIYNEITNRFRVECFVS